MQACSWSGSAIMLHTTPACNKPRVRFTSFTDRSAAHSESMTVGRFPTFCCPRVAQGPPSSCFVTCTPADAAVLPFLLAENSFHRRPHRKVATTHTLPNIQMSLSLRTFSMMGTFLPLCCPPVQGCLYFENASRATSCWHGALIMQCCGSRCASRVQPRTRTRTVSRCCPATCPLSRPFTRHPASSLPPTPGPKRREHAASETRRGQVVLGRWCWVRVVVAVRRITRRHVSETPEVSVNFRHSTRRTHACS